MGYDGAQRTFLGVQTSDAWKARPGDMEHAQNGTSGNQPTSRVLVRIAGRADWYDKSQTRSATRFPRYEIVTVEPDESTSRRGSIASFNQDDDDLFSAALLAAEPIEVDQFRIHWLGADPG